MAAPATIAVSLFSLLSTRFRRLSRVDTVPRPRVAGVGKDEGDKPVWITLGQALPLIRRAPQDLLVPLRVLDSRLSGGVPPVLHLPSRLETPDLVPERIEDHCQPPRVPRRRAR